ncbi:hypothetical protein EER27_05405 [Lysobacter psychrotolerans]|uniref:Uncharacterized protein n=1 Tax=Montanilutibacter psychrotolerans TaxID=1327343 RepID=A0A3M8SV88_9GAMM|nr:hypothetical protein EER27_05405 [Lysobacter psychrotolerans]
MLSSGATSSSTEPSSCTTSARQGAGGSDALSATGGAVPGRSRMNNHWMRSWVMNSDPRRIWKISGHLPNRTRAR